MKYYITKYHLEKLEKLVKALQKKTNVTFEVFENDTKVEEFVDHSQPDQPVYRYLTIAVELEINYKVGDYELVAELEHTGAGNIIRQINKDIQVPTTYRNVPCRCEHCNTLRKRNNTFLLVDKNNNFKQVGKNCLNEYTGIDTVSIINKVSSISFLLSEDLEYDVEFMEWLRSNNAPTYDPLDYMANIMYQIILEDGYSKESTDPFKHIREYNYRKELQPKVEEILNVVNTDWYKDENDYCHNVKVVLSLDYIEPKHWRILLSYINSAMNYLQRQQQKKLELEGLNNDYLGNVGDKVEFEIQTMKLLYTRETYYTWRGEISYVYRIVTTTNQVVIWKTSTSVDCDNMLLTDASTFKGLKGTIKELNEYKGEKQTVITRGKPTMITTHEQRVKEHKEQHPEEYETFNGKEYLKDSSDLAMAKFLAEYE